MIRDWRSDVCSSDLGAMSAPSIFIRLLLSVALILNGSAGAMVAAHAMTDQNGQAGAGGTASGQDENTGQAFAQPSCHHIQSVAAMAAPSSDTTAAAVRSEEHTSELQSLMRISYAVFCLKKKMTSHAH